MREGRVLALCFRVLLGVATSVAADTLGMDIDE
jgi:hypothetical protein